MLAKDVMTASPVCCTPNDTVDRAAMLMLEHDCGAIPVCDGQTIVGTLTDRDITCRAVATGMTAVETPVKDILTRTVYTIGEDETLEAAIDVMEAKQIRRLLVVDGDHRLVGIIAPSDLAPTFASSNIADFLLAVSYWRRKKATPAA